MKLVRIGLTAFVAIIGFLLLFWVSSPWIVRPVANYVLEEHQLALGASSSVRINPFVFTLEIKDFQLMHKNSELVGLRYLFTDLDLTHYLANQGNLVRG